MITTNNNSFSFANSRNVCIFVAKLQHLCRMSNPNHKISQSLRHYFRVLWAALCGRDLYNKERMELCARVEKIASELSELKEMYSTALDQWSNVQKLAQDLDSQNEQLTRDLTNSRNDVATFRKLVETLREHIREKGQQLDAYAKQSHT